MCSRLTSWYQKPCSSNPKVGAIQDSDGSIPPYHKWEASRDEELCSYHGWDNGFSRLMTCSFRVANPKLWLMGRWSSDHITKAANSSHVWGKHKYLSYLATETNNSRYFPQMALRRGLVHSTFLTQDPSSLNIEEDRQSTVFMYLSPLWRLWIALIGQLYGIILNGAQMTKWMSWYPPFCTAATLGYQVIKMANNIYHLNAQENKKIFLSDSSDVVL